MEGDELWTVECKKRFNALQKSVDLAAKEGRIYCFVGCNLTKIKDELKNHGFIQKRKFKLGSIYYQMPMLVLLTQGDVNTRCEQALLSRLIGGRKPGFVWIWNPYLYHKYDDAQILNKIWIKRYNFGLKHGLCKCIDKINWNFQDKLLKINYPRSYNVINNADTEEFLEDYKLTLATTIILFLNKRSHLRTWFSKSNGTIYYGSLEIALDYVSHHIKRMEGYSGKQKYSLDDKSIDKLERLHENLVKNRQQIMAGHDRAYDLMNRIKYISDEIRHCWPQRYATDGFHNTWLLKPAYFGQGYGIILANRRNKIMDFIERHSTRYVVQKYIEYPLLIYRTKFDIRQYFVVQIDKTHFRTWSHPLSSIKFAAQEFTLENLNKAVHITNTYIQRRYKKDSKHENPLPENHMWSSDQLIEYFESIGKPNAWNEVYTQMKQAILAVIVASVDNIDMKDGRFELFGCDWLITADYQTYLLEINRGPALCYYTGVSKYVCGTIMEDLMKG